MSREVEQVVGDVRDRDLIRRALKGVDVVHHHAALVPLTRAYREFRSVNVDGARVVAEEARRAAVGTLMHTSSSAVFGKTDDRPIGTGHPLNPIEPYGRSKLAGEESAKRALDGSGIQLVIIRPRTILGDARGGIFELFFKWIREGLPVYTIGPGENRFQFVHVDDLLSAQMLAMDLGVSGEFNVGAESFGTLKNAFENLIRHADSPSRVIELPARATISALASLEKLGLSPLAPWHYRTFHRSFHFDLTPLKSLGWSAQFSNDALLAGAYDTFVSCADQADSANMSPHRKPLPPGILTNLNRTIAKILVRRG